MSTLEIVGYVCLAYVAVSLLIAFFKPRSVWQNGKIQGFVKLFGHGVPAMVLLVVSSVLCAPTGIMMALVLASVAAVTSLQVGPLVLGWLLWVAWRRDASWGSPGAHARPAPAAAAT